MINITNEALYALEEKYNFTEKDKNIRIFIKGIGWGGPKFGVTLASVKANDLVKEFNGISVIVEKDLLKLYSGFDIDFLDSWIGKDFIVVPSRGGSSC